tara:strand:- start:1210 stop:1749 length:540 start_codon:yes stop_codon:yes gene_type:complete
MPEEYENLEEFLDAEEIEQQDEDTLLWVALGLAFGIDIFNTRIEREIAILRGSGVSDREIIRILDTDLRTGGRIFGELRVLIKRGIVGGIMQGFRIGQDNIYGDNVMMRWVSVGSPRICDDCESRVGQVDTWENWEAAGLPASGFSVCKENCYCQLVPEDIPIDDKVIVQGVGGVESTR